MKPCEPDPLELMKGACKLNPFNSSNEQIGLYWSRLPDTSMQ